MTPPLPRRSYIRPRLPMEMHIACQSSPDYWTRHEWWNENHLSKVPLFHTIHRHAKWRSSV